MTKFLAVAAGLVLSIGAANGPALAQQAAFTIWDVDLGGHVAELPSADFVVPACGTNGGPRGLLIGTFDKFALCPEEATGLREIWFRYDDQLEYEARAYRDAALVLRYSKNQEIGQPVVTSLLIDRDGLVQGLRVVTDSRVKTEVRQQASSLDAYFRGRFGREGWQCQKLPPKEGERPIAGVFIKEQCIKELDGKTITVESHQYFKQGQALVDPRTGLPMEGEFHSSARIEVVQKLAVDAGNGGD